jgi:hypothetical protein
MGARWACVPCRRRLPDGPRRAARVASDEPAATAAQQRAFAAPWQACVRRLLLEHADDPQVIRLERAA